MYQLGADHWQTKAVWVIITTNIHSQTQAALRSVSFNHIPLNQAIQSHPFIQKQVINHPEWVLLSLYFFPSRRCVWQDWGQVGVQVCPLIQNDRWPLSRLPGDSGLAGLTWRASCTSGRQGTGQTWCLRAVTEALAMYREIICLWREGFLECVIFIMCDFLCQYVDKRHSAGKTRSERGDRH